jgi:N-acetylmuramoyl-L-alanine amidase CwlA
MPNAPSPPYVGPCAHTSAGSNRPPVNRVVIHATVSPCVPGGARAVGAYFRSPSSGGSAHYIVDPAEAVQAVYDNVIAWHAPPNEYSLGIEICDPQTGSKARWEDAAHTAALQRAAHLTAALCAAYDVPMVRIEAPALLRGEHGVCGHVDVSNAWHQSDHTDPGPDFPWQTFMGMVDTASGSTPPTPKPVPNLPPTPSHNGDHKNAGKEPNLVAAIRSLHAAAQHANDPGRVSKLQSILTELRAMP